MRMKKIVYVMKSFAVKAGVERVMSDKMNYLAGQGYEVVMVTYEQGQHPDAFPLHPAIRHLDLGVPFFPIMKYGLLKRLPKIRRLRQLFKARLQALLDAEQPDVLIVSTCSIKLMDIVLSAKTRARKMIESHAPCYAVKKSVYYQDRSFVKEDGRLDIRKLPEIMVEQIQKLKPVRVLSLEESLNIRKMDMQSEVLEFNDAFFSPKVFDSREVEITPYTYAIHHYQNSWFSPKAKAYYRTRAFFVKHFGLPFVRRAEKLLMPWRFRQ